MHVFAVTLALWKVFFFRECKISFINCLAVLNTSCGLSLLKGSRLSSQCQQQRLYPYFVLLPIEAYCKHDHALLCCCLILPSYKCDCSVNACCFCSVCRFTCYCSLAELMFFDCHLLDHGGVEPESPCYFGHRLYKFSLLKAIFFFFTIFITLPVKST